MKIVHIIKKTNDWYAWQTALRQQRKKANLVTVLLLQDAVFTSIHDDLEIFACQDDVVARGVKTKASLASYEDIVRILLEADSIVCW